MHPIPTSASHDGQHARSLRPEFAYVTHPSSKRSSLPASRPGSPLLAGVEPRSERLLPLEVPPSASAGRFRSHGTGVLAAGAKL